MLRRWLRQCHTAIGRRFSCHGLGQGVSQGMVNRPVHSALVSKFDFTFLGVNIDINGMGVYQYIQHCKRKACFGDLRLVGMIYGFTDHAVINAAPIYK